MKIIDCACSIGLGVVNREIVNHENYPVIERVKQSEHAEDMLREMDYCGIDEAYVWHQAMYDTDPVYGNDLITVESSKATHRFHPVWSILPPITEPQFLPDLLLPSMHSHGVKALRAFPVKNRYFLNAVTMGDLLDVICEKRIPLYLSPQDNWEHIFSVLSEFPKLTVIVTNYGLWGSDRYLYPLIQSYSSVYIDTSDYQMMNGYCRFVHQFGSERLLFGSNYPMDNIGGPLATLLGSGISKEDIENILHRNVEHVMGEVRP